MTSTFIQLRRSLQEDGLYVFAVRGLESVCGKMRNYVLAKKLGVQAIRIGPRANLRGLSHMQIGEDFIALDGLWLHAVTQYHDQQFSPRIAIGNRARISQWVHIAATNFVQIGDDALIGSKVMITDHNHGQYAEGAHTEPQTAPAWRPLDRNRQVVIGNNVWLGDNVVVTPDSFIGDGVVVAANSVVRGSIPPFSLIAGAPATIIKTYDFVTQKWIRPAHSKDASGHVSATQDLSSNSSNLASKANSAD
jgi:lipopolysaccharide O-acetyltransferase